MNNIIFLDIDGVLNVNDHSLEISSFYHVDEDKVKLLSKIVKETNAQVVIHSAWRFWFDENLIPLNETAVSLSDYLVKYNIPLMGVTPDFSTEEIRKTKRFSLVKANEILEWLNDNPDVDKWIVLDDLDLHNDIIKEHQVKIDPRTGITDKDVSYAINLLHSFVPSVLTAISLLKEAEALNPGRWVKHSENVALAAKLIAEKCGMDSDKAYVLGLLHDIGRRFGVSFLAHVYDGYHYLLDLGYNEAARIALTHSFNLMVLEDYIGKFDIPIEKQDELRTLLSSTKIDDYDLLIQLCDAMALPDRIADLETRMNDVKSRYGSYPQEKWDRNLELKEYFDLKAESDIYEFLGVTKRG